MNDRKSFNVDHYFIRNVALKIFSKNFAIY